MADNSAKPGDKKSHPAIFIIVVLVVLGVVGLLQFVAYQQEDLRKAKEAAEQSAPETDSASSVTIDVNTALSERILGNTSAPVKISEHASLTCGHCGAFHRETFDKVKKDYIDTGKAYLVFSDFPLNAPALQAAMVARCLPQSKYFDFIHMLFVRQEEWAYDARGYLDFLKAEAGKAGLDAPHFKACVESKELEEGIKNRMQGAAAQWNISSTPSFVINNRATFSGAMPYEEFRKALDSAIENKEPTPAGNAVEPSTGSGKSGMEKAE